MKVYALRGKLGALFASMILGFTNSSIAQTGASASYPAKTVTIIVPAPTGGPTEVIARTLAESLRKSWNQPVVVDFRPGASAIIGSELVATSPPDGYTLLLGYTLHIQAMSLFKRLPYDPLNSFVPVTQVCTSQLAFVVRESDGPRSVAAFVSSAKANPGRLSYGNWGIASSGHLYGELLNRLAGINVTNVSYKGVAPVIADILGGHITGALLDTAATRPHIAAGRLRPIAITGSKRSELLPEVPTLAESGYAGFEPLGWFGILAPARTPSDIVTRLGTDIRRALAEPEVASKFEQLGLAVVGNTPDQFAAVLREDAARWAKLIQDAGIQPQ